MLFPVARMKTLLTVIFLIALSGTSVFAQKTSSARTTALQLLINREPKVKWSSHSLRWSNKSGIKTLSDEMRV